jgi:hypothetical protein
VCVCMHADELASRVCTRLRVESETYMGSPRMGTDESKVRVGRPAITCLFSPLPTSPMRSSRASSCCGTHERTFVAG